VPPPCPFLPQPERPLTHEDIHALGKDRSARFYQTALGYAQTMWLSGFPAKALLLVSRAQSCRLEEVSFLTEGAMPYHAVAWIVQHRPADRFIGNPRLHYQHLATRMVEPHRELRRWRAWACWYLTRQLLPESEFPSDTRQIREESTVEPRRGEIAQQLKELSPRDDLAAWEAALEWVHLQAPKVHKEKREVEIMLIQPDQVEEVRHLAHHIWPEVYPSIISMEQIQHMLDRMYDVETMRREIREHHARYALIREEGHNVGYVAWQPGTDQGVAFLSKLYLLPGHHGHGLGAKALDWAQEQARLAGHTLLTLRVNRHNHAAVRAYLRAGFGFEDDVCTDIGNGFVMDDYVMSKVL
jgi:GNAT superfamily N-acetyltransferase